ncbi:MAG: peptidoglycan DD-metalloendopeptidase family protein [Paludibacter sp.]|nr:peptidoglycan DD-metalloendopeptidase family protein [Paludibacter sp.]
MRFQSILRVFFLIISFSIATSSVQAQSVKDLESQRKQTLQKLATTNKLLNETNKSKRNSLNKLTILTKNIKDRKVLINTISTEINQLDVEMQTLQNERRQLENRLESLKTDYAKLVQEAHTNRSTQAKIMFILSAKSFDQSYRRLRYLQEYTNYRKQQVLEIQKVTAEIAVKNETLAQHKSTKVEVVTQKQTEADRLTKDEKKEKVLLTDLQKKEKTLRANLKVQQKKANDLNNKIEQIIAEQIRKAEEKRAAEEKKRLAQEKKSSGTSTKTEKESKTKTTSSSSSAVSALTKEETLLSGNFEKNKGRLPWPTASGFISGHFGVQPHPVLKHVTTNNKGIYLQTPVGTSARAVFDGVVTQKFLIQSSNGVIIQHGEYRTVYANLSQIYVNVGDHVSVKQPIGKIYTDDEKDNKTELYFQVWKGRAIQNPESWIAR